MELKEGYKQTDVGVIPEDWELLELPKLYSIERNASYSRADTVNNGPVKYLHYGDIHTGLSGLIHRNEIPEAISQDDSKGYHLLCSGDVVLADASEDIEGVGAAVEIFNPNNEACIAGLHTIVLSLINNNVATGFGALFSKMPIVGSQFRFYAAGLKVFGLSKSNIRKVILPLPPFQEQQAIAEVLSDVDAEIESLARRHEKLLNQKQGLSEELLSGRIRLVEPKSKGFKQTDVGVIPEDWGVKTLESIADVVDPHPSHRAPEIDVQGIPFYGIGDLTEDGTPLNNSPRLVPNDVLVDHIKRYDLSNPSLALGRVASIGKVIDLKNVRQDFALSPTLGVITANYIQHIYLKHILEFRTTSEQFDKIQSGSTRSSVGMNVLRELLVVLPPLLEQKAIAEVLSDVDAEIRAVAKLKAKVQAKKEGLMQTLLTGKIRLT